MEINVDSILDSINALTNNVVKHYYLKMIPIAIII